MALPKHRIRTSTQKQVLYSLAGLLTLATVGSIGWSISEIPNGVIFDQEPAAFIGSVDTENSRMAVQDLPELPTLRAPLFVLPTPREPLTSPSSIETRDAVEERLYLKLIGTVLDAGQRIAILSDATGSVDVTTEGETLNLAPQGVVVQQIEAGRVTVLYRGTRANLKLQRDTEYEWMSSEQGTPPTTPSGADSQPKQSGRAIRRGGGGRGR